MSGLHSPADQAEGSLTDAEPKELLVESYERGPRRAWLVGGAAVAASSRSTGLLDECVVSVAPTILGSGGQGARLSLI